MIRTQIQLTEEQAARIRSLATAEGRSMADVIRESVEAWVEESPVRRNLDAVREEAVALVGKYRSDSADLARSHDRYLAEDLSR